MHVTQYKNKIIAVYQILYLNVNLSNNYIGKTHNFYIFYFIFFAELRIVLFMNNIIQALWKWKNKRFVKCRFASANI